MLEEEPFPTSGLEGEFLTMLAHELRGPLVGIKGLAATGRAHGEALSTEERREYFTLIEAEADRMNHLVTQAATLLALETAQLTYDLEAEPLLPLLGSIAERHELVSLVTEPEPGAEPNPVVLCDRTRTIEVCEELLTNAARFSATNQPVELRGRWGQGPVATIEVRDGGPGLTVDVMPRAFERFANVRPAGYDDVTGAGLGLYLAQAHVAAQGGRLWMAPRSATEGPQARGTMLAFTLPLGGSATE